MLKGQAEGQVNIELVVIVGVVFVIVMLVFSYYFAISDSTIALITLKTKLVGELNAQPEPYIIKEIEFVDCGDSAKFNVITEPGSPNPAINTSPLILDITQKTKWDAVVLSFNAGSITC